MAMLLVIVGCGGDPAAHTVRITIDARGGAMSLDGVRVIVPPGAVSGRTALAVRRSSEATPGDCEALSRVFVFEPEGLPFTEPVLVTFEFKGEAEGATVFWTWPRSETIYDDIGGAVTRQTITTWVHYLGRGFVGRPRQPHP
jgi:hypothetical protein